MDFGAVAAVWILMVAQRTVTSTHPECSVVLHLLQKERECRVNMEAANETAGCAMEWDGLSCWPTAAPGDSVNVPCPQLLIRPQTPAVQISRTCTEQGWGTMQPPYHHACWSNPDREEEEEDMRRERQYFDRVRLMYSGGYGVSLVALLLAVLLFCSFRKLLCTRNCIHLNLFLSFMLRSTAVFVKDSELFWDQDADHCTVATLKCKAAVTFFHFCVLANFSWLLVEGLYLQTLLLFTFTDTDKFFWIYAIIGWGLPTTTITIWALLKKLLDDDWCWDDLESSLWWIIKLPILLSIFINFLIFINVSRIIVQKTRVRHVHNKDAQLSRRLLRSTLLLIPLFGVHYTVFALVPDHVSLGPRLYLELVLGSFQGLIVAVLYCFLNGEVQTEIRSWARGCRRPTNANAVEMQTSDQAPPLSY